MSEKKKESRRKAKLMRGTNNVAASSSTTQKPEEVERIFAKPPASELPTGTSAPIKFMQAQSDDPEYYIPNQVYMVLSYVAPPSESYSGVGAKNVMIKVSGGFPDKQAAEKQAEKIKKQPHHLLIESHVVPFNVWLTIPMPKAAEMYSRKVYVDQPVLDKLMKGAWESAENSRKEIDKRKRTAVDQNRKRLKALYGENYESPKRDPEEVKKEQEQMEKQEPPKKEGEKEKTYSLMDISIMYAKFLLKSEVDQAAQSTAPKIDMKKMTPETRQKIFDFKVFIEKEANVLEDQIKDMSPKSEATSVQQSDDDKKGKAPESK